MKPVIRHLIVCEDVKPSDRPTQFPLSCVIFNIRWLRDPPFPLLYSELWIVALCIECRGKAVVEIRILEEDTGASCY